MVKWLNKIAPKQQLPAVKSPSLPARATRSSSLPALLQAQLSGPTKLPNAAIIYGCAASGLCVVALFLLFSGRWFTSFLVLLLAICFLGFALHFMRHSQ